LSVCSWACVSLVLPAAWLLVIGRCVVGDMAIGLQVAGVFVWFGMQLLFAWWVLSGIVGVFRGRGW